MSVQIIDIPRITLEWSSWTKWSDIDGGHIVIPEKSGVYEVKNEFEQEERLTIGKGSNLRNRIVRGLVWRKMPHSAGKRIRSTEDTSKLEVRWAYTDRPCAVEEHLHITYQKKFVALPKYTKRT